MLCSSNRGPVSDQLKAALVFLKDRVLNASPKKIKCVDREVMQLYTDACFEQGMSGLGGVLYSSSGQTIEFFSHMLDDDQISLVNSAGNRTIIGELEALAIVVGLESIALQFSGCDIIVFVDNESALASMIKVGSSNDFMCAASLVADLELDKDYKMWFERVPSNSNPAADDPSRGELCSLSHVRRSNVDLHGVISKVCDREVHPFI